MSEALKSCDFMSTFFPVQILRHCDSWFIFLYITGKEWWWGESVWEDVAHSVGFAQQL